MTLLVQSLSELKAKIREIREHQPQKKIGFVPTMGALHAGHFSLIQQSVKEQDFTVVSIFVNPLQFGPSEDFEAYPRPLEKDFEGCKEQGVDFVFTCQKEELYPPHYQSYVEVEGLTDSLCGASRPGHFRGVTTVVCKLFNLVQPHVAYFGKKDAQQCLVLQKMVEDLNMNLELCFGETIREEDGLALSSRNQYLSKEERTQAICLKKALDEAALLIESGEKDCGKIIQEMKKKIESYSLAKIDYIQMVDQGQVQPVEHIQGPCVLALAVFFNTTRLIDNLWISHI